MYHVFIGTRSILYVVFAFRRHVGYFLIQLYVPCILIVFLSWVGLWLNREATNDRINLGRDILLNSLDDIFFASGVTTVLTLIFVIIEGKKDLPKVSYATALDLFLAVCFIFVFSTLFEFALVHYYTKARTGDLNENMRELEDYVIQVCLFIFNKTSIFVFIE
jgi:gamma-aminobutyric acid receptor subunit alpha